MSQVTFKDETEKVAKKRVYYEGSDTLREGYALCYNQDYGTASDAEYGRAWRVEKPATANLHRFAGIVAEEYDSVEGPCMVEVYIPTAYGQIVKAWTDQNCTITDTKLAVQDGSYALGAESDGYTVARCAQTVNRGGTAGTVLVELHGADFNQVGVESELTAAESELQLVSTALVAAESRLLLAESEAASNDSQLLLIESEAASNDSEILLLESEVAAAESELTLVSVALVAEASQVQANSEAITAGVGTAVSTALVAAESRLLLAESEVAQAQSEVTAVDSQLLLIESEAASNDSEILLLESEVAAAESELTLVSVALVAETSQVQANSEAITAAESELTLVSVALVAETSQVQVNSEAITAAQSDLDQAIAFVSSAATVSSHGVVSSLRTKKATISIDGTDYDIVIDVGVS